MKYALESPTERAFAFARYQGPSPLPAVLLENPAVRLFVTRAQQAKPDFQLIDGNARAIAEICHRLDGLPLAIEIAAARVRMLPPAAMLTRLGSRLNLLTRGSAANARQQTLRDTIGWSYNLLEPEQQWAFRSFSVFEGGASVEAAESVLSALNAETNELPLDLLDELVDQSLLVIGSNEEGDTRLRMLETVREYAAEQLSESNADDSARNAHTAYFLAWMEQTRPLLTASRDGRAIRAVRGELDNLRGALVWLQNHDADGQRLRFVNALFPYWRISGPYAEATEALSGALATAGGDPRERAWALSALGWLAGARGDLRGARPPRGATRSRAQRGPRRSCEPAGQRVRGGGGAGRGAAGRPPRGRADPPAAAPHPVLVRPRDHVADGREGPGVRRGLVPAR